MAQPSGQVLLDSGKPNYAATSFWYCDGTNLWDAKAGATLTKTGTAGTASEGGANVVLGNGSTYYALASSISLTGDYTIFFKARTTTNGSTNSMVCGTRTNNNNFVWLASSGTRLTVRANSNSAEFASSNSATMAHYALVRDATGFVKLYKDGTLIESKAQTQTLLIDHILSGYTGTSFIHNGALEFMHIINGVALDATAVSSYYADPYQDLLAGAVTGSGTFAPISLTAVTGSANASGIGAASGAPAAVSLVAVTGTASAPSGNAITLTSPAAYQSRQRDLSTGLSASPFTISGTYTGTPTSIQYRFAGGAWTTLIASPSGGTFSTTLALPTGQGTFEVRFSNDTGVTASAAFVTVGDGFASAGQSNACGRASGVVSPVASAFTATKLGRDGVWKALTEANTQAGSFDEATSAAGSYYGALSNLLQAQSVPVFFIPCALGGVGINEYARFAPDPSNPVTLYGDVFQAHIASGGLRGIIFYQGETDAANGNSQAGYTASLNTLVNNWWSDIATPTFIVKICRWNPSIYADIDAIRAAQQDVIDTNPHAAGGADANVWTSGSVHYSTTTEVQNVADAIYAGMVEAFYAVRCTLTLTTNGTTPAASQTGISWAWWDAAPPNLATAPVQSGTGATTDASGVFDVALPDSSLIAGQTGTLLAIKSDGTAGSTANSAFCAPVVVS